MCSFIILNTWLGTSPCKGVKRALSVWSWMEEINLPVFIDDIITYIEDIHSLPKQSKAKLQELIRPSLR